MFFSNTVNLKLNLMQKNSEKLFKASGDGLCRICWDSTLLRSKFSTLYNNICLLHCLYRLRYEKIMEVLILVKCCFLRRCSFGYLPIIKMPILYPGYDSSASSSVEEADKLSKVKHLFKSFKCLVEYSFNLLKYSYGRKTSVNICRIFSRRTFVLIENNSIFKYSKAQYNAILLHNFVVCLHLKLKKTQTKNYDIEYNEIRKCLVITVMSFQISLF
jgi:hypothetical protein